MKTNYLPPILTLLAAASVLTSAPGLAQDVPASQPAPQVSTPPLAYGVSQILQLTQAKVSDDTIVAYIQNSGNSYGLNADQIIFLRQQGVSTPVLNAMLSQPRPGVAPAATTPAQTGYSAPAPSDSQPMSTQPAPATSTSIVGPSVTAIDPTAAAAASTTYYYYQPYYPYTYYPSYGYYPYYGVYPGVSLSFGWGGRWGGWHGGGFRGGFHGGWHR